MTGALWNAAHTVAALLWLAALWYAAPLIAKRELYDIPTRLRYTLVLALAIPLALATIHMLSAVTLFAGAVLCCGLRYWFIPSEHHPSNRTMWDYAPLGVTLLVASPNMVRPPLDGDSLAYHLPNAIAWVQAGSLAPTWMRYWWYPGGSEITVAGIIACGGLWIAGVASLFAAAMLFSRIAAWLRELDVAPITAIALTAAFAVIPAVASQTYDARNDLVLTAWFVESLWMLRGKTWLAVVPLSMLALMKPDGWVFVLIAVACMGRLRDLIALVPFGIWAAHDALLAPHAQISVGSAAIPSPLRTTIAAHFPKSMMVLGSALINQGAIALTSFFAPLLAMLAKDTRRLALAGTLALVAYMVMPFSYGNNLPQLADGASLRFAIPVMAIGVLLIAPLARRFVIFTTAVAAASAIIGVVQLAFIFSNDMLTIPALAGASIVFGLIALTSVARVRRAASTGAAFAAVAFFIIGAHLGQSRAPAFYAAEMPKIGSRTTLFFRWFRRHPHKTEVLDIRAGELLVLAPQSQIADAANVDCARALAQGAWIVVGTDPDVPKELEAKRMLAAWDCGRAMFHDADVVAVSP